MKSNLRQSISLLFFSIIVVWFLAVGHGTLPPLAKFFDPAHGFWTTAQKACHPKKQILDCDPLEEKVTVVRDHRGVPHIFAQNDGDLAFAMGYVQAQDRLWQMEIQTRLAAGRLAEVAGIQVLESDKKYKSLCLTDAAQRAMQAVQAMDEFKIVEAFTNGVNFHLSQLKKSELPLEYKLLNFTPESWKPVNLFLLLKLMAWDLSGSFDDLRIGVIHEKLGDGAAYELFPVNRPYEIPIIPNVASEPSASLLRIHSTPFHLHKQDKTFQAGFTPSQNIFRQFPRFRNPLAAVQREQSSRQLLGSNNWVIDGSKSASGHAILASDPHLSLTLPSIWYEAHLVTPEMDVRGVSLLGTPGIIIGFNRHIAWGQTNVGADVTDFFIEQFDSEKREKYLYNDEWLPVKKKTEIIKVKGSDDEEVTIEFTHHGPLVTRHNQTVAMKWIGHDASLEVLTFVKLNKAKCYDDFCEALRHYNCPAQNFAYADVDGNIAMWCAGKYPIRKNGDGRIPVDGTTDQFEWMGYVPFEEIPHSLNPPQHFLVSNNQRPAGPDYSHYLGWKWYGAYRSRRINELLKSNPKITFEQMQNFQCDNVSTQALSFLPYILKTAQQHKGDNEKLDILFKHLRDWDGSMRKDLVAPRIFVTFMNCYQENTWVDEFFVLKNQRMWPDKTVLEKLTRDDPESPWFDDLRTPEHETRDDIILRSLLETYDHLCEWEGEDSETWKWGAFNQARINHLSEIPALGFPPFPADGYWETLNVCGGLKNTHGPSWRMVVELAENGRCVGVYPGGQSGNPISPHFDDGVEAWANYKYFELTMPKSPEEIPDDRIESIFIFKPRREP